MFTPTLLFLLIKAVVIMMKMMLADAVAASVRPSDSFCQECVEPAVAAVSQWKEKILKKKINKEGGGHS